MATAISWAWVSRGASIPAASSEICTRPEQTRIDPRPHGRRPRSAKANGVKMGRKPKLTDHQKREAVKRRDHGEETLAEIGRSYTVSGWTISRLPP
jgi:hypothetical protein